LHSGVMWFWRRGEEFHNLSRFSGELNRGITELNRENNYGRKHYTLKHNKCRRYLSTVKTNYPFLPSRMGRNKVFKSVLPMFNPYGIKSFTFEQDYYYQKHAL
jgi:hypothetical protein